jgi:formyltetrahydrofolate synthetase
MPSELEIAHSAKLLPIADIAHARGLSNDDFELYGKYKAKISLDVLKKFQDKPDGKYVVVTAITPTPLGEGKTTTSVGLAMAMNRIGYQSGLCLRQASLGPVFGIKGGAAGGGYAQVVPFEDINLHLTGDAHAVQVAHNLLSAFVDNSLFHGNPCDLDPFTITWQRVVDMNDRALRKIVVGLGGKENGVPREAGFDIVAASEVMAILALVNGEDEVSALRDLRAKLRRIVVGQSRGGKPVTADDLHAAGAMTVLMRDALKPNLLQTLENTPAFIHSGPFGNIAHGNNSILEDKVALKLNEYVITEAGFGSDLGMEKFFDIKCRYSGLRPNAAVMVTTIRALKMHGGVGRIVAGKPLPEELVKENLPALEKGAANLVKHIENARLFGVPVVVAVNHFPSDTDREIALVEKVARDAGAEGAFLSDVFAKGGAGAISLAEAVAHACSKSSSFKFLYHDDLPIKEKIERIVTRIYGGDGVDYLPAAEQKIKLYTELGYARLPICMAKTHLSLSHDEKLKGRPRGFRVPIRDIRASVGAGFLYPLCGEMRTMPGLPSVPAGARVDIDDEGNVVGLF